MKNPASEASEDLLEGFPLSPQQRRVWNVLEAGPRDGALRALLLLELKGNLNRLALAEALGDVVARYEILRTRFARLPGMTLPVQVIAPPGPVEWSEVSWSGGEEEDGFRALIEEDEALRADSSQDLVETFCRRIVLVSKASGGDGSESRHLLLISLSPLLADSLSLHNLSTELKEAYAARCGASAPGDRAEEPMQYADFSQWQNDGLESEDGAEGRAFWASLELPADASSLALSVKGRSPSSVAEGRFGRLSIPGLSQSRGALSALAQRLSVASEVVLLAACQVVLQRFSSSPKTLLWGSLDGRGYEELEQTLGLFRNFAPFYLPLDLGRPFQSLVRQVAEAWEERLLWQEYLDPTALTGGSKGDALAESPPRDWTFEVLPPVQEETVAGVRFRVLIRDAVAERSQLRWLVEGLDSVPAMTLVFDRAFLGEGTALRLVEACGALLVDALQDPERSAVYLSLLPESQRRRLLSVWNPRPDDHIPNFLEKLASRCERSPKTTALSQADQTLTYGEMWARAGAIACHLRTSGLGPGGRVGLFLRRRVETVPALLGVLRAGLNYVALHPDHPPERLLGLLSDASPAVVLCSAETESLLPSAGPPIGSEAIARWQVLRLEDLALAPPASFEGPPTDPRHLAYVVFTSGSTGKPKGIEVSRRGVDCYLDFLDTFLQFGADDKVLQLPDLIYDASIRDLMTPLLSGSQVVLVDEKTSRDPAALLDLIEEHRITALLSVVPTLLRSLIAAARGRSGNWSSVHTLLSSGEKLFADDVHEARALFGEKLRLINLYGPSECTLTSTYFPVPAGELEAGPIAIGRPIARSGLVVADEGLRLLPPGLTGEACITGVGLARGYLGQPARTAASFVPDPFSEIEGARLFKTGDDVTLGEDGSSEILGRRDGQLKILGVRVELGEIETALRQLPGVREAAVGTVASGTEAPTSLCAWVVPEDPLAAIPEEQRHCLPNGLPIRHLNRYETDFFYQQIFVDEVDVRHGLHLAAGDVVFDVGANIGLFSLYTHLAYPGVRIFAFEPIPKTCSVLRSNLDLYGTGAEVECCGLSSSSGEVEFAYYPLSSCQSGYYPDEAQERRMLEAIIERQTEDPEVLSVAGEYFADVVAQRMQRQTIRCPLKTVSEVMEERGLDRVDLLKIDVEKSELDVLRGIREEDWPRIRQVSIEAHDLDGRLEAMTSLLEARGYRVTVEQEDALLDDTCLFNIYATRSPFQGQRNEGLNLPQHLVEGRVSGGTLRRGLSQVLPGALIPNHFLMLESLPRTSSGKVDRRSLPHPESFEGGRGEELERITTPTEEIVKGAMASVLGASEISSDDDFFSLGGHSLLGTQLVLRLNQVFRIHLPLQNLFASPSVRQLAGRVEEAQRQRDGIEIPPLKAVSRNQDLPLSFAQRRLWFLEQLESGGAIFNLPGAVRIRGSFEAKTLDQALTQLVTRQEVLRTSFCSGPTGEPVQVIATPTPWVSPRVDLQALSRPMRQGEVERLLRYLHQMPFSMETGPVFRTVVLELEVDEKVVHFNLHHIAGDAWSTGILVREMTTLIASVRRGAAAKLRALAVQYADYAHWQRSWLQGANLEALTETWVQHLAGAPPVIDLPLDGRRGEEGQAASMDLELSSELYGAIEGLNRTQHTSLFMTLLAALDVTLHSFSGARDLIVGADIAHRSALETEDLIGFFVNQIVLRVSLEGDPTFYEILARSRTASLFAYQHQDLPFERLVEALNPDRGADHAPIFQVKLIVQNTPSASLNLGQGLEAEVLPAPSRPAREELLVNVVPSGETLQLRFKYNSVLLSEGTLRRLAERLCRSLELATENPHIPLSQLVSSLQEAERVQRDLEEQQRGSALSGRLQSRRRSGRASGEKSS